MPLSFSLRQLDSAHVQNMERELAVHPVTARCLVGRGVVTADAARSYLEPRLGELRPPEGLAGLGTAVERLVQAVERQERVGIFGDYDADGVTTTALLTTYLQALGATCEPRVARRSSGYGFGVEDADYFADASCTVVITGDCGTSDIAALDRLRQLSIDSIVIDHHTVPDQSGESSHPATALINPFRSDSSFPFRGLASVGLSFYVMAALRSRLRKAGFFDSRPEPDIREQLDFVALGTIADLVPLTDENRILVRMGLEQLGRIQRPGVRALMDNAGVSPRDLSERSVGFRLGPRLNAPGRLGDARPALDVLLAATPAVARAAAAVVEQLNDQRRAVQDEVAVAAEAQLAEREPGAAVVVAGKGWPPGVVGVVAARLVDRYQRPAFVLAIDEATGIARGSARSFAGVNLYAALDSASDLLERFGGHAAAAGLTISADKIESFAERVADFTEQARQDESLSQAHADAEVDLEAIDHRLIGELESLAPFGKGNDEPILLARGVKVRGTRRVGDGSHLKLELVGPGGKTVGAIGFGMGARDPGANAVVDLAFRPSISTWGGRRNVELELRELSPSQSTSVELPVAKAGAEMALASD